MKRRPKKRPLTGKGSHPGQRGQPSKFAAASDKILAMVKLGNYLETAAAAAGIHKATLYDWLKHRPGFADQVRQAQAEGESLDVACIAAAAKTQWPAAAWRLERKNPRRWGPRIQISVQEELDAFLDHLETSLPPETYEAVLAATASYDGRGEARALAQGEDARDVGAGDTGDDPTAP